MTIAGTIKGQLTRALNTKGTPQDVFNAVRRVFAKHMPSEQAKHATRAYLAPRLADFARR